MDRRAWTRIFRTTSSSCPSTVPGDQALHHLKKCSEPHETWFLDQLENVLAELSLSFAMSQHVNEAFFVPLAFQESLLRVHGDWRSTLPSSTKNARQKRSPRQLNYRNSLFSLYVRSINMFAMSEKRLQRHTKTSAKTKSWPSKVEWSFLSSSLLVRQDSFLQVRYGLVSASSAYDLGSYIAKPCCPATERYRSTTKYLTVAASHLI